jgi:hypothetical protein
VLPAWPPVRRGGRANRNDPRCCFPRGAHSDRGFRWRRGQGWWHGWPSRPLGPWLRGRLRQHRGDRTQLLAMGARPRQGVCLLLNRHRQFQYLQRPRSCDARPGLSICETCERHTARLVPAESSARNTIETFFAFDETIFRLPLLNLPSQRVTNGRRVAEKEQQ